ncbi:MAG: hypothetical protein ACI4LN_01505, partial [Anaerovoracaceae bacterium]
MKLNKVELEIFMTSRVGLWQVRSKFVKRFLLNHKRLMVEFYYRKRFLPFNIVIHHKCIREKRNEENKMKQMKHKKRNSKKYTICNPVIFSIVMQNPELCRGLLERIFPDRKVKEVQLKYEIADDEEDDAEDEAEIDSEQNTGPDAGISDGIAETERTVAVAADAKSVRLDVLFEND